jgi:hypothetical protein
LDGSCYLFHEFWINFRIYMKFGTHLLFESEKEIEIGISIRKGQLGGNCHLWGSLKGRAACCIHGPPRPRELARTGGLAWPNGLSWGALAGRAGWPAARLAVAAGGGWAVPQRGRKEENGGSPVAWAAAQGMAGGALGAE